MGGLGDDWLVLVSHRGNIEGEKKWNKQREQGSNEPHISGSPHPFLNPSLIAWTNSTFVSTAFTAIMHLSTAAVSRM